MDLSCIVLYRHEHLNLRDSLGPSLICDFKAVSNLFQLALNDEGRRGWIMTNPENDNRPLNELAEGVDFVYVRCCNGTDERLKRDPKDFDQKYEDILYKTHMEADQLILEEEAYKLHGFLAYDHMELKKKILKEKYGITWRHIYELNPEMVVD